MAIKKVNAADIARAFGTPTDTTPTAPMVPTTPTAPMVPTTPTAPFVVGGPAAAFRQTAMQALSQGVSFGEKDNYVKVAIPDRTGVTFKPYTFLEWLKAAEDYQNGKRSDSAAVRMFDEADTMPAPIVAAFLRAFFSRGLRSSVRAIFALRLHPRHYIDSLIFSDTPSGVRISVDTAALVTDSLSVRSAIEAIRDYYADNRNERPSVAIKSVFYSVCTLSHGYPGNMGGKRLFKAHLAASYRNEPLMAGEGGTMHDAFRQVIEGLNAKPDVAISNAWEAEFLSHKSFHVSDGAYKTRPITQLEKDIYALLGAPDWADMAEAE